MQELSLVAMESCGGSSYWARLSATLGHEVMVIPPRQVKPFRTGQKTDANDAIAIAVASQAVNIKPARYLNVEQQSLQSIERMREMLERQRLQLSNQIRGLLLEFGLVINKSVASFKQRIPEILEDAENELTFAMREALHQMWHIYLQLGEEFKVMDQQLKQLAEQDEDCRRLMHLEGVGPIGAIRLKLYLENEEHFKNGRSASACVGVTPKQHSSGGKVKMGSISKSSGNHALRSCLFLGARAVITALKRRPAKAVKERWINALTERRGVNCAAIALANKTVRTAHALLKNGTDYKPVALLA